MLKSLFGGKSVPPAKLPKVHGQIDVFVPGRPSRSVSVESVGPKGIVARDVLGKVGENVTLVYTNDAGRFRAQTRIAGVTAGTTHFEPPRKVDMIGAATCSQKRQSVRLDTLVSGHWRFAPGGKATGELSRGSIQDISRGGCSLTTDRAVRTGTMVEVRLQLKADGAPLTFLGEVMRHQEIPTSGRHLHGLRFQGMRPEEDQAIVEFINRRQAQLRNRGLA